MKGYELKPYGMCCHDAVIIERHETDRLLRAQESVGAEVVRRTLWRPRALQFSFVGQGQDVGMILHLEQYAVVFDG